MNRQRPRLKNGVDLQLQSAFHEGNWLVVARLADKRARTLGDSYYEILKICAESQCDEPGEKLAAVTALWQYVKDGTVIKDVDAIDLLEWATLDLLGDEDYPATLGPLRVRAVKAAPKNRNAATRCLESCLLHWDLNSAQQIAALMDRSFPQERSFMFWNVVITHMLATSPQSPPEKKKLYGMLAQKQIERAAQLVEQSTPDDASPPPRGIQTEEEILLLYDIVETHGSPDDFQKIISSPVFCPLAQFRQGRKEPFQRVVTKHQKDGDWEAVFRLCHDCLSQTDETGQPVMLVSDWGVWQQFIAAASLGRSVDVEVHDKVHDLLSNIIKSANLKPIYKRNLLLARVLAAFDLVPADQDSDVIDGHPASLRLRELIHYIDNQITSVSCFDDIKQFIERLDAEGMKLVAYQHLPQVSKNTDDVARLAHVHLLSLKTQFFVSSCPLVYTTLAGNSFKVRCAICSTELDSTSCTVCLASISRAGMALYTSLSGTSGKDSSTSRNDILPDIAILVAFCSIRLALSDPQHALPSSSSASARDLLRALFILEHQLFVTPKHSVLSLLVVQLHVLLGSAYRAREVWDPLAVKRTIVDSLAPLFYDRFSTICPAAISPGEKWGRHLMDTLKSHYDVSLKLRMPRRLVEAFEDGSYSSVMGIPEYIESLRRSGARAMGLVEEARAERLLGSPISDLLSDSRFNVTDDTQLTEIIDYGSFPSWDSSSRTPLYAHLRLGPPPSNRRSHLSLLSEAFHDVLTYKPPTVYKVPAAAGADQTFVLESMSQISNSMNRFLNGAGNDCTASEMVYLEVVSTLSTLISHCAGPDRSASTTEVLVQLAESANAGLEGLSARLRDTFNGDGFEKLIVGLKSMHDLTLFHDTAVVAKLAAEWVQAFNEREKARDRSGSSNLPKDLLTQKKALKSAAEGALKEGKAWIAKLKDGVSKADFDAKLRSWVFEDDDVGIGSVIEKGTVSELGASWRMNVKGWQQVKWE